MNHINDYINQPKSGKTIKYLIKQLLQNEIKTIFAQNNPEIKDLFIYIFFEAKF